ncbi:HEAT repeat domain-containing protein [Syntrophomonas wolfei]|uniref:HEAT repeat domain-containing protein n=3 Tax=Syntrophomonas wolfei TaxID=863 RepID=UPI0023F09B36|nr:HEAT repeat domain-containing protein [Syntrophomonas wolfei]
MKFISNEIKNYNWRIRKDKLEKLARSGTADSIAALIQALQDVHDEVAQMAAESLVNIGLPAVQPLIATLLNGEWPLSDLAGETLAQMGAKATKPLEDLLTIPRYTGRVAYVLSQSTDPEALSSLLLLLKHENSDIREMVIRALGSSGDKRATYPIIRHIKQYGASPTAILALGEIADFQAVPLLIEELKGIQRWFAARALGQIGEPAVEALIKVLNQSEYNHQGVAVYALGLIRTEKALASLTEMVKHPDQIVSWRAAMALIEIEQKEETNEKNMRTLTDSFTLTLSPTAQYFYASIVDELLYLPDMNQFLRTPVPPPFPVPCRYSGGKANPEDFIALDGIGWLISDRLRTLFTAMGFTGWATYPVELRGKNGELIHGYHGLFVSGKIGPVDYTRSQVQIVPHTLIGLEPDIILKGLYPKDHSWDGSDFFLSPDSALLMVSELVIKALSSLKPPAKNWIAEPLSEVKRSIRFEKNISFLTKEQKEQLHELRNILESHSSSPVPLETKAALEAETEVKQLLDVLIKNRCLYQTENPVDSVCIQVVQDFGRLGQSAVDELLLILQNQNREHRAASAWVLGQLNIQTAVEPLIKSLSEEDEQVLAIIIGVLGRIGDRRCIPYLIDIFNDSESEYIRCCVAETLGRLKDPQAVPLLLNVLPHEGSVIVLCALVDALASLDDPTAITPLINLYVIGDANLNEHIKQALIKLGSLADLITFLDKNEC